MQCLEAFAFVSFFTRCKIWELPSSGDSDTTTTPATFAQFFDNFLCDLTAKIEVFENPNEGDVEKLFWWTTVMRCWGFVYTSLVHFQEKEGCFDIGQPMYCLYDRFLLTRHCPFSSLEQFCDFISTEYHESIRIAAAENIATLVSVMKNQENSEVRHFTVHILNVNEQDLHKELKRVHSTFVSHFVNKQTRTERLKSKTFRRQLKKLYLLIFQVSN